ncbi:MAG: choice-of-anchor tandem repeat GloVer-containing protein [Candidatus Cybelea sp.]
MRNFAVYALSVAASALLPGCGVLRQVQDDMPPQISVRGAMPQISTLEAPTNRTHYKVVYSFEAGSDGSFPRSTLIDVGSTLYGTTEAGGVNSEGTVFSVTPGGSEKVLHSFGKRHDGNAPEAGLVELRGTLYGTTRKGGSYDACYYSTIQFSCGTVFSITTGGREKVLHSFSLHYNNGNDGANPVASLIKVKGTLYGTTLYGGSYFCPGADCGTVFSVTPGGTEKVLHSFSRGADGYNPVASLVKVNGTLYGTTQYGGTYDAGTVFSIAPNGTEKVLHSFGGSSEDGTVPQAALINVKGTLYGTTLVAADCNGIQSCGTVFSITPGGTEKVLYHFRGGKTDGGGPSASLINVKGTFYGTTTYGGANYNECDGSGCGTVFSITPSGKEKVLHSFAGASDGQQPLAGLINVKGTLYGTTAGGGTNGYGTVFALAP